MRERLTVAFWAVYNFFYVPLIDRPRARVERELGWLRCRIMHREHLEARPQMSAWWCRLCRRVV